MDSNLNPLLAQWKLTLGNPDHYDLVADLLRAEGLFPLEAVTARLDIDSANLKQWAWECEKEGGSPEREIGIIRTNTGWLLHMGYFREFYHNGLRHRPRPVHPDWDANRLLRQKGRFLLTDVCRKLPFTIDQIRYRIKTASDPETEMGIIRRRNRHLVDMEIFAKWIRGIWHEKLEPDT